jgi:two-component system phosphate regulon sensor histidine kinase PhoR
LLLLVFPIAPRRTAVTLIFFYTVMSGLIWLTVYYLNRLGAEHNARLLSEDNLLSAYIQDANDWIFSLDKNGRFSDVNRKVCQSLGLEKTDFIGRQPLEFIAPEDRPHIATMLEKVLHNEDVDVVEVKVPAPDGRFLWLEVRGRTLIQDGRVAGTIHIARDVTERHLNALSQQKLNWETTLLYEASKRLSQSLSFDKLYQTIYDIINTAKDCPLLLIYRFKPQTNRLDCVHIRQNGEPLDHTVIAPQILSQDDTNAISQMMLSGQMRLVEGETAVAATLPSPDLLTSCAHYPQAVLFFPLKFETELHGLIQAYTVQTPAFTPADQRFWEAFVQQAAVALANARLFAKSLHEIQERRRIEAEIKRRQAEAETLRQAVAVLNSSLSLEVVLSRILEQLRQAIPYDSASVQQKEGDNLVIRAAKGFPHSEDLINLDFPIMADLPNAQAMRTLKPLAIDDIDKLYPAFNDLAHEYQADKIVSWLGVPLFVDDTVLGMITIDRNEVRPFTSNEIALAVTFADHAAIALRNAHLYQEMENHNVRLEQAVAARTTALQRTTEQAEAILDNSPDAILLLDINYQIERVNPAFEALFGYQASDVMGTLPFELATPDSHIRFITAFQTAVTTGSSQRLEITARRKDQSLFDVTVALAPIYEQETIVSVVCSLHDISGFKEVERLKDDFVSNVSHELRTPIANLKLHHDLIKLNPQKQSVYLERQEREIERLTIIIESLLRLSRLDQQHIPVTPTAVNLSDMAQQYVEDRTSYAESRGLTLHHIPTPSLPTTKADGRLLGQAVGIILTNALNYTPPNGQITLRGVTRQKQNRSWAGLSIHDTGAGIPQEEQALVFNRFYRGQAGRASGAPGTGLGLAIAAEIIALHQGEIELISSGEGQGTTFIIWLPATEP